jgi:hypothetical protein
VPTQLQLEGPDLESLLARVKTEHGAGARIVRAERVRTGGIAGFFAKQRFEVSIEVSDLAAAVPAAPAAPTSLLDLADQVSDSEHQSVLALRSAGQAPAAAAVAAPVAAPVETPAPAPAGSSAFAAVLADVSRATPTMIPQLAAPAPTPAPAAPHRPGEIVDAGRVPAQEALSPELVAHERSSTTVSTEGTSFASLVANLDATAGTPQAAGPMPTHLAVPQSTDAAPAVVEIPLARSYDRSVVAAPVALPVHLPFGRAAGHGSLHGQLARLGLPPHLVPTDTGSAALYPTLLKSLEAAPQAPAVTNRAGNVLAIVGPLPQALEAARSLARDLGLPLGSAVVVATSHRGLTDVPERQVLRDLDTAQTQRAAWRRRRNLTIVAVDAPMTAVGASQARAYLSVLEPSLTWGAVEATRKTPDVGAFARAVGGLDALAVSAVEETSDPAAVLELGIPVARLGGRSATPAAWAALLTGRLAA